MAAGTWLGGIQLADPAYDHEGETISFVDVGAFHEMLDGSIAYDYVGSRIHWHLKWNHVTTAEKTTLSTQYQVKTAQTFSPPDVLTDLTVLVVPNSWRSSYIEGPDGTKYWDVEFEVEKTTAA